MKYLFITRYLVCLSTRSLWADKDIIRNLCASLWPPLRYWGEGGGGQELLIRKVLIKKCLLHDLERQGVSKFSHKFRGVRKWQNTSILISQRYFCACIQNTFVNLSNFRMDCFHIYIKCVPWYIFWTLDSLTYKSLNKFASSSVCIRGLRL